MDIRKNRAIKAAHNDYVSWAREQEEKEKKLMIEIEHIGDVQQGWSAQTAAEQKFDLRKAAASVDISSPRKPRKSQNNKSLDLSWQRPDYVSPENRPNSRIKKRQARTAAKIPKPSLFNSTNPAAWPKLSQIAATTMQKYDSEFSMTHHLTVPSPKGSTKLIGRLKPRRRSSRLSSATTAAFSDSHSAHSTCAADNYYESEISSTNIVISDLFNKTVDCSQRSGSKIRRDMFGNLRAVPEHRLLRNVHRRVNANRTLTRHTNNFTSIQPEQDILPLLDPHIYVNEIMDRLTRSQDPRPVNRYRTKFSERHRNLQTKWNPFLSRNGKSTYAHNYNLY